MDYKQAGVNIEEGYRAVDKYRELATETMNPAVLNHIGDFAGLFSLGAFKNMEEPTLVSGADGVGTKLEIAFRLKKYDTVGVDCVAMSVNDVICHGAKPLFFLDYLSCGKLDAEVASELVKGVSTGCKEAGCALLGGETAEMPGFYEEGVYDLAGFVVGVVDRKNIIDGSFIQEGDRLIGIASSGPHSNGFSLIRKALPNLEEDFGGSPIGYALLEPTRIYARPMLALMERVQIKGMAHITGGGFYENIPRMFNSRFDAVIDLNAWQVPPIFARISDAIAPNRPLDEKLMFNTFNMGVGFVLTVAPEDVKPSIELLSSLCFPAWEIGRVASGSGTVRFV
jgi:phosphoribosylformylglycinamidine cyclo-ligase